MAINNCPTCEGKGYHSTVEEFELGLGVAVVTARTTCWCSWATPNPAPPRVKAVYWLDETPPGKIFDVGTKFLTTDDEFTRGELNLLKWYVGQWVDKLMALAEDSMTAEAFAEHSEFMDGWLPMLAAASDRRQLVDVHNWLVAKGVDPY